MHGRVIIGGMGRTGKKHGGWEGWKSVVKLPAMTARDVERVLQRAGFVLARQTGHRIWQREGFSVPVPAHRGELKQGTLRGIITMSGMSVDEFLAHRDR